MAVNQESLNRKLYGLLKVKGYNPVPKDSSGQTTPVPDEAEVFKFTFKRGGQDVGDVWITIDSSQNLVIYYDDEVADDDENTGAGGADFNDSWTGLIQHLKNWAQRRQLSFELKNKNHLSSDMAQRAHMKKEERTMESVNGGTALTEAQNAQQKYLALIRKYKLVTLVKQLADKLQKKAARTSDPDLKPMYASDARKAVTVARNLQLGNIKGARIAFSRQDTAARDLFFNGRYTEDGWRFTKPQRALALVLGTTLNTPNIDDEDDSLTNFKETSMMEARKKVDHSKKDPYEFDDDGKRGKGPTGKTRTAKAAAAKKVDEDKNGTKLKLQKSPCMHKGCKATVASKDSNYCAKHEKVDEGYYPMGKKASYSDNVPSVKIILQHTRQIEEGEQRYRNIARIFLENTTGERILAPTIKPGIARIYARHLAEGGLPHNDRWNHIGTLVEEYTKMAGFVRATRTGQFNESAQELVKEGINHYNNLRESLNKLTTHRGYNEYFESWTPILTEESDTDETLTELFVQEKLDPRIECVMPILSKLRKRVNEITEVNQLAEWADSVSNPKQLNEYLLRAGDKVSDILELNVFQDFIGPDPVSVHYPDFKQDPNWMKVEKKYTLIAQKLAATLKKIGNRKLSQSDAEELERTWYDGSDAYDDPETGAEFLPPIYDAQIEAIVEFLENRKVMEEESLTSNNPQGIPEEKESVVEGATAEADMIIQNILNGRTELYTIMNKPVGKVEQYVSQLLRDMYADQAIEHGLHQDDDFEKIEQRMMDQLEKEYGRREQFDLTEAPVDRTKYNTWEEFKKGAADRGLEIEGPYADVENGPSADDPYESTMVKDANGDYIGMYWHDGEVSSQGVIFNNADDFYRWQNEGDQDTPDADPGDMDGDHDSAMRDAGMGTDEDYGTPADEMFEEMRKLAGLQEAKKKDKKKDSKEEAAKKKRKAEEEGRDLAYSMDGGRQQHSWGMGDDGRNRQ
jgi:hypothetical protein